MKNICCFEERNWKNAEKITAITVPKQIKHFQGRTRIPKIFKVPQSLSTSLL